MSCSSVPDSRARGYVGEVRREVVDVEKNSRLISGVDSRDGDKRAWIPTSSTSDGDLGTTDVELGTTVGRCDVQSDLFTTDEILTTGERLGDREREVSHALRGEGELTVAKDGCIFPDFEPGLSGAC